VLNFPSQQDVTVVHVAGSNGKGSTSLKIAKTFELSKHTTGLFVSPHISSFRERMLVNSIPISESEVERLLPRVFKACEENNIPATFFEITTALAFLFFAERGVDVVVLETGLGGRLDSTNVIKNPALSVITSISLEHTTILGDTIEKIAREKGGIIKKGRPVLVGDNAPHDVLRECSRERQASAYYTCEDVLNEPDRVEQANGFKDYDKENTRLAKAAIAILQRQKQESSSEDHPVKGIHHHISNMHISEGTSQRPSCRFELVKVFVDSEGVVSQGNVMQHDGKAVQVVLDVAHNPSAIHHLTCKLESTYPNQPKRFIAGFSSDKDIPKCLELILLASSGRPNSIHIVQASHPRAASIESILEVTPDLADELNFSLDDRSITAQIQYALRLAKQKNEVLVVCGSVFLMAEARQSLGFKEPMDSKYISEVAGSHLKHGQENFSDSPGEQKLA